MLIRNVIACVLLFISVCAKTILQRNGLEVEYSPTFRNICYSKNIARLRFIVRVSLNTCLMECALHGHCVVAQYQLRYHLCELFKSFDESEAVERLGCVIVKRSDMVIKQFPCAEQCQNRTACDLDSKQCVYKECQDTPSSESGNILGNCKETDSKVRLQCYNGDEDGVQKTTVCQTDGSWSTYNESCSTSFQCPASDTEYTSMLFSDGTTFTFRFVHETKLSHTEAIDYCKSEGAHLMASFPEIKREVLRQLMRNCSTTYQERHWVDGNNINATDFNSLTDWVTSNGEPFPTDFWLTGQPDRVSDEHCAYLNMVRTEPDNIVCNWRCSTVYYFICEK